MASFSAASMNCMRVSSSAKPLSTVKDFASVLISLKERNSALGIGCAARESGVGLGAWGFGSDNSHV